MRNEINRKVNCDTANADKTVAAAQEQLAAIRALERAQGLDSLPEGLQQAALLRIANPEASLADLAALSVPAVSKSCLSHRLKRLVRLAARRGRGRTDELRTPAPAHRILPARRRVPHRRPRRAGQGAGLRRPRHNRPRRHVRGRELLPRLPQGGHKAHHRLRGLRRAARAHGPRVRRRQPLHPPHTALQGRDGLQQPQLPRLHGLRGGLLRQAAHRLALCCASTRRASSASPAASRATYRRR